MAANPSSPKRLRDLLPSATYRPADSDPAFAAVRTDASLVRPGDLYVHLDEFDSFNAEVASARGAEAIVAERLLPDVSAPQVLVDDSVAAHRELVAATEAVRPPGPAQIVVGGSSGTDRVATLLAAIHAHAGERVGLLTDACEDDAEHCVPRGADLKKSAAHWLRRCELGQTPTAVVQASPGWRPESPPVVACLTSLRCDGLDPAGRLRWDSPESHRASLAYALGPIDGAVTLVVNADDPDCVRLAAEHTGGVVTFGESDAADIWATPSESYRGGQTFVLTVGGDSSCVALPTPGRAARRDAVAAIATAIALGFEPRAAIEGVDLTPPSPGRLEPLPKGQAFAVYLDAAVRPLDLADALEGARGDADRLLATVRLADDPWVAKKQIETAAQMADRVLAYGSAEELGPTPGNVTVVEDRLAAIAVTLGLADAGDAVLVAGCREAEPDSDRAIVTKLLRRLIDCEGRRAAA